ncbi:MAG TPA: hypothetical protein VMU05_11570 [Dongiaceae bacterium]|nr:hypothetical protein [Dongiaceae bacterium]
MAEVAVNVTCVLAAKDAEQVPGQLMPAGLLTTVPWPPPDSITVICALAGGGAGAWFKVNTTLLLAVSAKVHVGLLPLHPEPCHPPTRVDESGVATSLIDVPEGKDAEQPLLLPVWHEMPSGVLTTAPVPFPAKATVNWTLVGGCVDPWFMLTTTFVFAVRVKVHDEAVPVHPPPCQPPKTAD